MKRTDLLKQKKKVWCEIEQLKRQRTDELNPSKSYYLDCKVKELKKKYDFINTLLKANKQ